MKYSSKRILSIFCISALVTTNIFSYKAYAEDIAHSNQSNEYYDDTDTAGLITYYYHTISSGTKTVYITSKTNASDIMAEVGFVNISVQRSTNGTSNWTEEKTLDNDLAYNAAKHSKYNDSVPVVGGYYYRVVLDHYAKETGWFLPSHESITNYSNVVWVPV